MASLGWCGFGDPKFAGAPPFWSPFPSGPGPGGRVGLLAVYLIPIAAILSSIRPRYARGLVIAAAARALMVWGLR
jgi:hypothetical protein